MCLCLACLTYSCLAANLRLLELRKYSQWLFWSKMASETISEHLISNDFLREHAPAPLATKCLCRQHLFSLPNLKYLTTPLSWYFYWNSPKYLKVLSQLKDITCLSSHATLVVTVILKALVNCLATITSINQLTHKQYQ